MNAYSNTLQGFIRPVADRNKRLTSSNPAASNLAKDLQQVLYIFVTRAFVISDS